MRFIFIITFIATLLSSCVKKDSNQKLFFLNLENIILDLEKKHKTSKYEFTNKIFNSFQLNCPIYIEEVGNLLNTCVKKYTLGDTCNFYIPTEICEENTSVCNLSDSIQTFTRQGIFVFSENNNVIPINESYERLEINSIRYVIHKTEKYFFLESYNPYTNGSTNFLKIYVLYKNKVFAIESIFVLDIFFKDFDKDGILDIITINKTDKEDVFIMNFHSITELGINSNENMPSIKIQKNQNGLYKTI